MGKGSKNSKRRDSTDYDDHQELQSLHAEVSEVAVDAKCIWDQTGCEDCDEMSLVMMETRCDRMTNDQEMCEGAVGAFNRCLWSQAAAMTDAQVLAVNLDFSGVGQDCTLNVLLVIAGLVTAIFVVQQGYRWWKNREYQKLQTNQPPQEIQITSHGV